MAQSDPTEKSDDVAPSPILLDGSETAVPSVPSEQHSSRLKSLHGSTLERRLFPEEPLPSPPLYLGLRLPQAARLAMCLSLVGHPPCPPPSLGFLSMLGDFCPVVGTMDLVYHLHSSCSGLHDHHRLPQST